MQRTVSTPSCIVRRPSSGSPEKQSERKGESDAKRKKKLVVISISKTLCKPKLNLLSNTSFQNVLMITIIINYDKYRFFSTDLKMTNSSRAAVRGIGKPQQKERSDRAHTSPLHTKHAANATLEEISCRREKTLQVSDPCLRPVSGLKPNTHARVLVARKPLLKSMLFARAWSELRHELRIYSCIASAIPLSNHSEAITEVVGSRIAIATSTTSSSRVVSR